MAKLLKNNPSLKKQSKNIPSNFDRIIKEYIETYHRRDLEKKIAKGQTNAVYDAAEIEDDIGQSIKYIGSDKFSDWWPTTKIQNPQIENYLLKYFEAYKFLRFITSYKLMANSTIRRLNPWLYRQIARIRKNIRIHFTTHIKYAISTSNNSDDISNYDRVSERARSSFEVVTSNIEHIFGQEVNENSYSGRWYMNELNKFRFDETKNIRDERNMKALDALNKKYEEKLVEENANRGLNPKEECHRPFLKIDSKWIWYMDESGAHGKTGEIMGHCGNVPQYKTGDVLLNLGEVKKDGNYNPKLTFIINRGVLGERKGKANSKPKADYHPQIMQLLLDPRIIWLGHGQYKPENDFQLKDLSARDEAILLEKRPDLFDIKIMVKKLAASENDFVALVKNEIPFFSEFNFKKDGDVYTSDKSNFSKFIARLYHFDEIDKWVDRQIDDLLNHIGEPYDRNDTMSEGEKRSVLTEFVDKVVSLKSNNHLTSRKIKLIRKTLENHIRVIGQTVRPVYDCSEALDGLISQAYSDAHTWIYSDAAQRSLEYALDEGFTASGFFFGNTYIDSSSTTTYMQIKEEDLAKSLLWHLGVMPQPYEADNISQNLSDNWDQGVDYPDSDVIVDMLFDIFVDNLSELAKTSYEDGEED